MERIPFNPNERLQYNAETIGNQALIEVTSKYGSGDPVIDRESPPLETPLAYHNAMHTVRVREAAGMLARRHGLPPLDQSLAVMIASAHDVYHDRSGNDESLSADWLADKMKAAGFSEEDQEIARLAILGTIAILDTEGSLINQQYTQIKFPSERASEIALCVAAADLESIFAAHGPAASHDLFKERNGIATVNSPQTLDGLVELQHEQIKLLHSYTPLYTDLETIFGDMRHENLQHQKEILKFILSGVITDWEDVEKADQYYYSLHT